MVRPPTPPNLCLRCKGGRNLCGKPVCPILLKTSLLKSIHPIGINSVERDRDLEGLSPPGFFVGHYGYPRVNVGPLVPVGNPDPEKAAIMDAPSCWFGKDMSEIITYRSQLVRTAFVSEVIPKKGMLNNEISRLLATAQELAMGSRPVGVETHLEKIRVTLQMDNHTQPMGPIGIMDRLQITENVPVHPVVDYVVGDTDLLASEAISEYLFKDAHLPLEQIQRVLSAGLLGRKKNRRLVPTRWAITAVDDTISKAMVDLIRQFPQIDQYYVFHQYYLGNKFYILMAPGTWSFEMMEVWAPNSLWNVAAPGEQYHPKFQVNGDFEFERGRTKYADNVTGAYYAARKEVCDFLLRIRRQAKCILFREVDNSYVVPLGVWVIRETVKHALASPKPEIHESLANALGAIKPYLVVPWQVYYKTSKILPLLQTQRTLDQFLKRQASS